MITRTIAFSTKIVTKNDLTTNLITLTRYSYFNVTFLLLLRKITNYHISTAIITVWRRCFLKYLFKVLLLIIIFHVMCFKYYYYLNHYYSTHSQILQVVNTFILFEKWNIKIRITLYIYHCHNFHCWFIFYFDLRFFLFLRLHSYTIKQIFELIFSFYVIFTTKKDETCVVFYSRWSKYVSWWHVAHRESARQHSSKNS